MTSRIFLSGTLCLAGLFLLSSAEAAIRLQEDRLSRNFGYVIGDLVTRSITLEIEHPHNLQREQIPESGKINHRLELRSSNLEIKNRRGYTRYELTLMYQIFNTAAEKNTILLPGFELTLDTVERRLPIVFQGLPIQTMRITPDDPTRSLQVLDLQPLAAPQLASLGSTWFQLIVSCVGIVISLLILAFLYTGLPWIKKLQGPFSKTFIKLRSLKKSTDGPSGYQRGLRYLHDAFNQTHGKVLLHDDLDDFLQQHASFNQIRPELAQLFAKSRAVFFSGADSADASIAELLSICRKCRDIERGLL